VDFVSTKSGLDAYSPGSNPDLDQAIQLRPQMQNFLQQLSDESVSFADSQAQLLELVDNGL
jgi:flagellar biosynthesis/type III secretory pathway ATPase